jgi:hypothetical protein
MAPRYIEEDRGFTTPCWVWQLQIGRGGYGYVKRGGRPRRAHRVFYEDRYGPIPDGMQLDHLCKQRACVNPDHLEAVTHTENVRRSSLTHLTTESVQEIREASGSQRQIARRFGISQGQVSRIRAGHSWA